MLEPLLQVPDSLVDARGEVSIGVYEGPLRRVHLEEATVAVKGIALPRFLRRFRLKRWQHYGLVLPDLFVGLAIVDAGFLRTAWCSVVDRTTGESFEHQRKGPLLDLVIPDVLWDGRAYLRAPGFNLEIHNHLDGGEHSLSLRIAGRQGLPAVRAELRCLDIPGKCQPMVVVLPVGARNAMYSHKAALPLVGSIEVGGREVPADQDEAFAILDIHEASYPHHTWWRWATFAGRHRDGRAIAMNLTENPNEQDDRWNENGIWVDGWLHRLDRARFHFDEQDLLRPWHLSSVDGAVDLTFTPQGERQEHLDLGLVKSTFHQPWGTFAGRLRVAGESIDIADFFGVCEDHDARW
ncbi:MAG: DUF2804 domain-containing protein [Polyangia bacterium]|jgi:hypothetical protein|nr:DUF2804 domain-containing protein [Polyangia bacterium]